MIEQQLTPEQMASEAVADGDAFYDFGWNARVRGEAYKGHASRDWRDGWKDCDGAPEHDRQLI